jgi:hypothetical protein
LKDVISAISVVLAFIVFLYCLVHGAGVETALIRALVTFGAANIIGFFAFGFTIVIIHQQKNRKNEELESDNNEQAPVSA